MKEIIEPRSLNQIIEDFLGSAGSFGSFYQGMSQRERTLFKGWIHSLRVQSHSPLVHGNNVGLEIEK